MTNSHHSSSQAIWGTAMSTHHRPWLRRRGIGIAIVLLTTFLGCESQPPAPPRPAGPAEATTAVPSSAQFESEGKTTGEWWYQVRLQGEQVGHRSVVRQALSRADGTWYHWREIIELEVKRYGATAQQSLQTYAVVNPGGQVKVVGYVVGQGQEEVRHDGTVLADGTLLMQIQQGKEVQTKRLPWSEANWGYLPIELSLSAQPLQAAEVRQVLGAQPLEDQLVQFQLTDLGEVEANSTLRRVDVIRNPQSPHPSPMAYQVDSQGVVHRADWPQLQQEYLLCDRDTALRPATTATTRDFGRDVRIPLAAPLGDLSRVKQVVYEVVWRQGDPAQHFQTAMGQTMERVDPHRIRIRVETNLDGRAELTGADRTPPTASDLEPSGLIDCRSQPIVAMADKLARGLPPRQMATEFERQVHSYVSMVDFSQVFASASETVASRQGDCSEHAVLLAALCRARGVPARVVWGLVYAPEEKAFFYHMWNDVWIGDHWLALDATQGKGTVGADHLRINVADLRETTVYQIMSQLAPLLNSLEITLVEPKE